MAATVQTTIVHLAQDEKFRYEKPFKIMLDVSELGYPQSNYELTESKTDAIDATSLRETLSINKNGFQFLVSPTKLHDSDFDDEQLIIKSYYPEVISLVQRLFTGGAEVFALGHRRRISGKNVSRDSKHLIPVPYAHVDYTPAGSLVGCRELFDAKPELQGRQFQLITLWRVTKGPNNDWPLALCDFQSIQVSRDMEEGDVIHRHDVGEHGLLYHDPSHRWYYLPHQQVEDVIAIRHSDTRGYEIPFAPHASFDALKGREVGASEKRRSIEVTLACFPSARATTEEDT
ncbi:hypothetical protein F4825DRAFT_438259 [Nemania diffusa]|nr:hypothetical protein F4825DRAFT_438259 [Nemania diffusa]